MSKNLPVRCQDNQDCHASFTCVNARRLALCGAETSATPVGNPGQNLKMNSACLSGSMSNADEDVRFSKLQAAFRAQKCDSFTVFATVFHTARLNKYTSVFQLAARSWQAVVLAVGSAGRLPAHFRTLFWDDAHSGSRGFDWSSTAFYEREKEK